MAFERQQIQYAALNLISGLLKNHIDQVEKTYLSADGDEKLTLSISLVLAPSKKSDGVDVEATLSFIESKVRDKALATVDKQIRMSFDGGETYATPHK